MVLIAVPLTVDAPQDIDAAIGSAEQAKDAGADVIEWRVDQLAQLEDGAAATQTLLREGSLPAIVTCRASDEGGAFRGSDIERAAFLQTLVSDGITPPYVDVEFAHWQSSPELHAATDLVRDRGARLILSAHDFSGPPAGLSELFRRIDNTPEADISKIAFRAQNVSDALKCAELLSEATGDAIVLAMGAPGLITRVLAGAWGAFLTFAALDRGKESAPGQPTLAELENVYHIRSLHDTTRLVPLFSESSNPTQTNQQLRDEGCNAVAMPCPVSSNDQPKLLEILSASEFIRL